MAELRGEVDTLRSIKESEREIDWCRHALTSLKPEQEQPPEKGCGQRERVSSPHQEVGRDLKGSSEWKQVLRQGSRRTLSLPTMRYEALAVEDWSVDDVGVNPSAPEELWRTARPTPCITTTSKRKKRRVIVVGDSL